MVLKSAKQSGSQKEKQILHISAYMWNLENGRDEPICEEEQRHRHREQTYGH